MKKLLLLLVFCPLLTFGQIGQFPYQLLRQMYRGDTVYTKLNGDSVNYYTDLGSFRFNKDIFVKGVKLGSGGGSDVAKYLKNYNPADTAISIRNSGNGFASYIINSGASIGNYTENTSFGTGNYLLNKLNGIGQVTDNEGAGTGQRTNNSGTGVGYLIDNTIPTVATAYAFVLKSKIGVPFKIDSLNTEKFTINSSGVPKINRYVGTGNRQIVVNSSGEIVLGAPSSLIATQLKNYNNNQDTVIRFPDLATGKFGIWQNLNSGYQNYIGTNSGYQNNIETNNNTQNYIGTNSGYQNNIGTNNSAQNYIVANSGYQNYIGTNIGRQNNIGTNSGHQNNIGTNSGYQNYIGENSGYQNYIYTNNNIGICINNSNKTAIGVKSYAADSVSLTSPARTGIFGKTGYYTDIDGFGQLRLYRNNKLKLKIDTAGHILNNPPHAYSIDTTSNFNITLTQNIWKQVTNATKNFWSNNAELDYFSFTGDTVVLAKRGHYTGDFNINIAGASGATYEYRIIQKNGTTKIVNKFTVKGTGEIVYRNVPFYIQGIVGTKMWVEVRFTGAPTGSPITVTGGLFRIFPIHLQ